MNVPLLARRNLVGHQSLKLANTRCRMQVDQEKDYLDEMDLTVEQLPNAIRQVFLQFSGGLEFDLCTYDMDRIAIHYLTLRGLKLPKNVSELLNAVPPPRCTFVVPGESMSEFLDDRGPDDLASP